MDILQQLFLRRKELAYLELPIKQAAQSIMNAFRQERKLLICGNGGSSSDSDHIVGEFMKSFEMPRPLKPSVQELLRKQFGERGAILAESLQQGLPAISLSAHNALITAISNDIGGDFIFAQQVIGFGTPGDVLLAISTSGNSRNIIDALMAAKATGLSTIGLTGLQGGRMKACCDVLINVPDEATASVQEYHISVFHVICRLVESEFFGSI